MALWPIPIFLGLADIIGLQYTIFAYWSWPYYYFEYSQYNSICFLFPPFVGWSKDWNYHSNFLVCRNTHICSLKGHHWLKAPTKLPLYPDTCWLAPHAGWHHWSIQYHEGFNPFIIDWNCQHFSVWHRLKIGYPRIWLLIIIMHGKITSRTRPPKFDLLTGNNLMFIQFHSPHIKRAPMLFSANNDSQKCQKGQKGTPFWDRFRFPPEVGRASPWERCQLGLRLFLFCQNWFKGGKKEKNREFSFQGKFFLDLFSCKLWYVWWYVWMVSLNLLLIGLNIMILVPFFGGMWTSDFIFCHQWVQDIEHNLVAGF